MIKVKKWVGAVLSAGAAVSLAVTGFGTVGASAATGNVGAQINAGVTVDVNGYLASPNGYLKTIVQGDGNVVLYAKLANGQQKPLWSTNTRGKGVNRLVLQGDGNLVAYTPQNKPVFASNTTGANKASRLVMQDDGNLVLYTAQNRPVWSSRTSYRVPTSLTLTLKAVGVSQIASGGVVQATGQASPNLNGQTVLVQVARNGQWITLASAKVANSSFITSFYATGGTGNVQYRSVFPGGNGLDAVAGAITVNQWGWYSLYNEKGVAWNLWSRNDSASVGGTYYPRALLLSNNAQSDNQTFLVYNLNYKCTAFSGVVGILDISRTGAMMTATANLDGTKLFTQTLSLGKAYTANINVTGGFRLSLSGDRYSSSAPGADVAWGSAQILCSSDPNPR